MKRRALLCLLLAITLLFTACGSAAPVESSEPEETKNMFADSMQKSDPSLDDEFNLLLVGSSGTYYYVEDLANKVRFVVLNTNGIQSESKTFDADQLAWLQNTALSTENDWVVVLISHQPLSNHYHAMISNAGEVISAIRASGADVVGCFSGHIHRDRIYTGIAVDTETDNVGENLPFTQVTITSDHTAIAYDDATKHPL